MPIAPNIAGHKNSFCTQVRCGNWMEDSWGQRHATSMPSRHAAAAFESTKYSRDYTAPGVGGPQVAFAPAPIDQLDGHLVMAHGTNIISREPSANMYMSIANGMNRAIKPQALLDAHAVHRGVEMRTDLIRQKAAMRAAGFEPTDPTILQMRHNVPAIATTVAKAAAVGAIDLGRAAVERFAPMTATSLGAAAAFQAIQQPTGPAKFARNGSFSATWKVAPRA